MRNPVHAGIRRLSWLLPRGPAMRQLWASVLLLHLTVGLGVVGYVVIADFSPFDGLYQTVLTVTTIGFEEIQPLDRSGRLFTLLLAVIGVGSVLYLLTGVAKLVIEGELRRDVEAWRMNNRIEALRDHYIICGAGRVGAEVARALAERREPFVLVDLDETAVREAVEADWLALHGDASHNDVLERAGVAHARALIAATGSDADNTFITLSAKGLNRSLSVIARANEHDSAPKLRQAGADRTVSPTKLAGVRLAFSALHPAVVDVVETIFRGVQTGDVLAPVDVQPGSDWEGATVGQAFAERPEVRVLGLRAVDGRMQVAPPSEVVLQAGDALMVYGTIQAIEDLPELRDE